MAIVEFFQGGYKLSRNLETPSLQGRRFAELEDDDQQGFLNYSLDIDLFVATSPAEVREGFRRMNSYTIPLNPEEERHAHWQGEFKWFINRLGHKLTETLLEIGTFSEKQIIRMQDTKLLAELSHAVMNGIQTTKNTQLTDIYRRFDKSFPLAGDLGKSITAAVETVAGWEQIHDGPLMRAHNLYALMLAIMHLNKPIAKLTRLFRATGRKLVSTQYIESNLSALAAAIEDPDDNPEYEEYIDATNKRTNVKDQRETRFVWMCKALTQKTLSP